MTSQPFATTLAVTILCSTAPAAAQEVPAAIRMSAACAPIGTEAPANPPTIRALGSETRMLYNAGERVAVEGGTNRGLQAGQRFFIRRTLRVRGEPRAEHTAGWLHIVAVSASTATAAIDFSCDAIAIGDHLEPFAEPALPRDVDRTNATGTLDFAKSTTVLYGNDGRQLAGDRDFILATAGRDNNVSAGARYAVFHRGSAERDPRVPFAEAIVVAVFRDKSLLRVTDAHDAVRTDDSLVLRVGGVSFLPDRSDAQSVASVSYATPSAPRTIADVANILHTVQFEDLAFDFDRYTLKPEALELLDQAAAVLTQNASLRVNIEGYSCNIGTLEYNRELGERRANAVRDYLIEHGVAPDRLTTVSYGEEKPKYDNTREETRRLNRRAALTVNIAGERRSE